MEECCVVVWVCGWVGGGVRELGEKLERKRGTGTHMMV